MDTAFHSFTLMAQEGNGSVIDRRGFVIFFCELERDLRPSMVVENNLEVEIY